ncbi:oplophorus-luciferin 2-monooxygenase non-catalytic subunit-like [Macrobrachium nipponense]|uniref:oplophorus-luciferin 2-monooxygenase non-catalytic subunit-like n=1 Tax=Macrobrachium nipponense TaxID=159736 RepID=UPI0030C7CB7D
MLFSLSALVPLVMSCVNVQGETTPSCPDPTAISPCTCSLMSEDLHLDCSSVASEEELETALKAEFPSKDFYLFGIYDNPNLKVIRKGIFRDLTFQVIEIKVGYLEEVEPGAFTGSALTLQGINLFNNEISSFPFEEVESYQKLLSLEMTYNNVSSFPIIRSATLQTLDLSKNPLMSFPADGLQHLPSLVNAMFQSCEISEVFSGTFASSPSLNYVTLFSNNISFIPTNFIELHGEGAYVYLGINHIDTIEVGAFKGVSRVFDIDYNSLKTVEEDIWRPVLEAGAGLYLIGNPLECGSDINWLIQEPKFMKLLDPYAACANGTLLSDLQPPH